jgi:mono/diheme cytochrome c family protein
VSDGRLSQPPSGDFRLPDDDTWTALGYLHANCGNCHNPSSVVWDKVDLDLWLRTAELGDATKTQSYLSSVAVALTDFRGDGDAGVVNRIEPGDAAHSGLILRMTTRGNDNAMPPIASEIVDDDGVALVSKWIDTL